MRTSQLYSHIVLYLTNGFLLLFFSCNNFTSYYIVHPQIYSIEIRCMRCLITKSLCEYICENKLWSDYRVALSIDKTWQRLKLKFKLSSRALNIVSLALSNRFNLIKTLVVIIICVQIIRTSFILNIIIWIYKRLDDFSNFYKLYISDQIKYQYNNIFK